MEESKKENNRLLTDLSWLEQKADWADLNGLGCVKYIVTENEERMSLRDIL